jgi:hypothetical protein
MMFADIDNKSAGGFPFIDVMKNDQESVQELQEDSAQGQRVPCVQVNGPDQQLPGNRSYF